MGPLFRLILIAGLMLPLAACQALPEIPVTDRGVQPQPTLSASPAAGEVAPVGIPLMGEEETVKPVSLEVKVIHQSSPEAPRYSIQARYPHLSGPGSAYLPTFNQAAEDFVFAEIGRFKESLAQAGAGENAEWPGQLEINFLPTVIQPEIASILFKVSTLTPGTPHPGNRSYSLTLDLQQGRVLALADLFQPGAPYLETLSGLCIEALRAQGSLAWEDGALPNEENYQSWNVTPEGLLVTFDEYRVAPYAAGPQTVLIPYEQLRPIAQADGPLRIYLP